MSSGIRLNSHDCWLIRGAAIDAGTWDSLVQEAPELARRIGAYADSYENWMTIVEVEES